MPASLRTLLLSFAALCIIMLGAAAYMVQAAAEPATSTEYAEYRNDRWHFSLALPADMIVSEHDREGGGQTAHFRDATGDKDLVISAWPYSQLDVTLGRIAESGWTSDQPDHLETVDVVRHDLFTALFQKNGVRYVVDTIPDLEPWLIDILKTWEFTEWRRCKRHRWLGRLSRSHARGIVRRRHMRDAGAVRRSVRKPTCSRRHFRQRGSTRSAGRRVRECGTRGHCNVYHIFRTRTNHIGRIISAENFTGRKRQSPC